MELFYFEITQRSNGKKFSFKIDRLKSVEEKDGYTKLHLDTMSIEILEEYQSFINRLKSWKSS
jgi:hypothetical protein